MHQVNSIRRGCLILVLLAILAAVVLLAIGVIASEVEAAPVHQVQLTGTPTNTPCVHIGTVRLVDGITGVNVRIDPAYGAGIRYAAIKPGLDYRVAEISPDGIWYKICGSDWAARITQSGQILLNFKAAVPTATPTRTPTRIPTSTPGPSPTEIPILETAIADESYAIIPFFCPEGCEGWIIVRPLP